MDCTLILNRLKGLFLSPKGEWDKIAEEETTPRGIIEKYALLVAAIPAIAQFIGFSIIGFGFLGRYSYRVPFVDGIVQMIFSFVFALIGVVVTAYIIDFLAPHFGMQKNLTDAFKVAVFSMMIVWAGGIFYIIPNLSMLSMLVSLYACYHFYLGLIKIKQPAKEKTIPFIAAVIIVAIVVAVIMATIMGLFTYSGYSMMYR